MEKKFSSILLLLTLCCVTIFFVGCNNDFANNKEDSKENYYNIDLTIDNYWKFLDWDKRNNQFNGVLSYAYYNNVVITLQRKIVSEEYTTNTYSENYTIELNAAGCKNYSFTEYTFDQIKELLNHTGYLGSYKNEVTIINISGKVQFSI